MTCLCFDLDGTICDLWKGEGIAKATLLDIIVKHSDVSYEGLSRRYDETWTNYKSQYMKLVNEGYTEHSIRSMHFDTLFKELELQLDPDQYATIQCKTTIDNIEIYPDSEKVVNTLAAKHPLCMITNGATDNQRNKIKKLPFKNRFKEIIVSGEIGHHKPSKVIFDKMAERMNKNPEEMIYIGNDYQKDILGGKAAGWGTVWVERKKEEYDRSIPDWVINELHELLSIF